MTKFRTTTKVSHTSQLMFLRTIGRILTVRDFNSKKKP